MAWSGSLFGAVMLCGYSAALPSGWTCAHRLRPLPRTAATTATQIGGREKLELSRGRMARGGASLSAFVGQSAVLLGQPSRGVCSAVWLPCDAGGGSSGLGHCLQSGGVVWSGCCSLPSQVPHQVNGTQELGRLALYKVTMKQLATALWSETVHYSLYNHVCIERIMLRENGIIISFLLYNIKDMGHGI